MSDGAPSVADVESDTALSIAGLLALLWALITMFGRWVPGLRARRFPAPTEKETFVLTGVLITLAVISIYKLYDEFGLGALLVVSIATVILSLIASAILRRTEPDAPPPDPCCLSARDGALAVEALSQLSAVDSSWASSARLPGIIIQLEECASSDSDET